MPNWIQYTRAALQAILPFAGLQPEEEIDTRCLFLAEETDNSFKEEGYAVLGSVPAALCQELAAFYQAHAPASPQGFHSSIHDARMAARQEVDACLRAKLAYLLAEYLYEYRLLATNFVVKEPTEASYLPPHQDWTLIADEHRLRSINLWIPLADTLAGNGALAVLPKSHKLPVYPRSETLNNPYNTVIQSLSLAQLETLSVPAGTIIAFDSRLIHASHPYSGTGPRPAVTLNAIPQEAQAVHAWQLASLGGGQVEVGLCAVADAFFIEHTLYAPPAADARVVKKLVVPLDASLAPETSKHLQRLLKPVA